MCNYVHTRHSDHDHHVKDLTSGLNSYVDQVKEQLAVLEETMTQLKKKKMCLEYFQEAHHKTRDSIKNSNHTNPAWFCFSDKIMEG